MKKIFRFYIIIFVILIAAGILSWQKNKPIFQGKLKSKVSFTISRTKYCIEQYYDHEPKNYLVVRRWFAPAKFIELSGFEDDILPCQNETVVMLDDGTICLIGDVGVHSQNIQFIRYQNYNLRVLKFIDKNSQPSENQLSDSPKFLLTDNNAGLTFSSDMRDYDRDPLKNITRTIFKFNSNGLVFDKEIDLEYNDN